MDDDDDEEDDGLEEIKEAWEPVMNCVGDVILGDKFILNEIDGRQQVKKLSFILHLPSGCFPIADNELSTEGLQIALDSRGENLLISFPKNKAVKKPRKYAKRAAEIYCHANQITEDKEEEITEVLEHQQKMLNMEKANIHDYYRTKIPLDFPCDVNKIIWFPVVSVNFYMALQVHLTGAQVCHAKVIKAAKITMLNDDDLPSS